MDALPPGNPETALIQPGRHPAPLAEYHPIPLDQLPDAIARLPLSQQGFLQTASTMPSQDRRYIARHFGISNSRVQNWLRRGSPFRDCWYSVLALSRKDIPSITVANAEAASWQLQGRAIEYGMSLSKDDRGSEASSKVRAIEMNQKIAGVLRDQPQTQVNVAVVLQEAARKRRELGDRREVWE